MSENTSFELARIRGEFITYLSAVPLRLRELGVVAAPDAILKVGRCIQWIGPVLDNQAGHLGFERISTCLLTTLGRDIADAAIALEKNEKNPGIGNLNCRLQELESFVATIRGNLKVDFTRSDIAKAERGLGDSGRACLS